MTKPLETENYLKKRLKYLIGYDQLNSQEKTINHSARTFIMAKQNSIRLKINRWRNALIKRYHQLFDQLRHFFQQF